LAVGVSARQRARVGTCSNQSKQLDELLKRLTCVLVSGTPKQFSLVRRFLQTLHPEHTFRLFATACSSQPYRCTK
jgi:hypothetical protein